MARAEVHWEDRVGAWRQALARMEDTSLSGACIRLSVPIGVGARLKVKWQREEFSGIAKYCRRDGGDYVLGIQRESFETESRTTVLLSDGAANLSVDSRVEVQAVPAQQDNTTQGLPRSIPEPELPPIAAIPIFVPAAAETPPGFQYALVARAAPEAPEEPAAPAAAATIATAVPAADPKPVPAPVALDSAIAPRIAAVVATQLAVDIKTANKIKAVDNPAPRDSQVPRTVRQNEHQAQNPSAGQERTIVFNKLLNRSPERQQQQTRDGNAVDTKVQLNSSDARPIRENHAITNARSTGVTPNQGSLLPLQDIYLAVGIMSSRLGYNIDTVSGMLDSDHLRGMASEVKRASVLMALEAAGIPVDELLRDGAKRLEALNSYEVAERKRFEDYEARKTQESAQIQLEVERMTAHCMDRIKHNLSEVTLAKDAFLNWQTTKQTESQRISDAVGLFSRPTAAEQPSDSKPLLQTVGAESK
jgi:hypothetical protein